MTSIEEQLKAYGKRNAFAPDPAFVKQAKGRILESVTTPQTKRNRRIRPVVSPISQFAYFMVACIAGIVLVAQTSTPTDPLFPVKILSERIALALAPDGSLREQVVRTIIKHRTDELEAAKTTGDSEYIESAQNNLDKTIQNISNGSFEINAQPYTGTTATPAPTPMPSPTPSAVNIQVPTIPITPSVSLPTGVTIPPPIR